MDSSKSSSPDPFANDEVDLGTLFYKIGKSVQRGLRWIGRLIETAFGGLMFLLLFLFRNIIWLLVGTALGLGYGIYLTQKGGLRYYSEMTVKTNAYSAPALYNTVEYINALISSGSTDELAKLFNITPEEGRKIDHLYVEPQETEMITADLYREKARQHYGQWKEDTAWLRMIPYKDFKQGLTKLDYPVHTITAVSSDPTIFSRLAEGVVRSVSSNPFLQDLRAQRVNSNRYNGELLEAALQGIDSLRRAYNLKIAKGQETTTPANQLTILNPVGQAQTVPELELYNRMLDLSEELRRSKTASVTEREIIEIIAPFNPMGQKTSFLQQSVTRFALIGLGLSLAILLGVAFYRWLQRFESRNKLMQGPVNTI